jgi:hypothetical protein
MKKYLVILVLLFVVSCEKDNEEDMATGCIKGTMYAFTEDLGGFKVQLIPGSIDELSLFDNDYTWSNAQVIITEKDGKYQFDGLKAGNYTLTATKTGYRALRYAKSKYDIKLEKGETKDISVEMISNSNGMTGKLQMLDVEENEISEIKFSRYTPTVSFLLYNGKNVAVSWSARSDYCYAFSDWYRDENKQLVQDFSYWVEKIYPSSGMLEPYEIELITIKIDSLMYKIAEHSSCGITLDDYRSTQTLTLFY